MKRIDDLAELLLGTSRGLGQACAELGFYAEDLTIKEREYLDELIFCCDSCGWWEEVCHKNDLGYEVLCDDCLDDEIHQF